MGFFSLTLRPSKGERACIDSPLAENLITCRGFDPVDQLERYVRWWRTGHLTPIRKYSGPTDEHR